MVAFVGPAKTTTGLILKATTIALLVSGILLGEGFICIVMASPLFMLVGVIIGRIAESDYWRHTRRGRQILPAIALPVLVDREHGRRSARLQLRARCERHCHCASYR